jgi:hypothetical protein
MPAIVIRSSLPVPTRDVIDETAAVAFTPDEVKQLTALRDHAAWMLAEFVVDPEALRRLQFLRWLVESGRCHP